MGAGLAALLAPPASALRFGLGNAAAGHGAKAVDKAVSELPSCGGALTLFDTLPVTDPALAAVEPLGHVYPPGHTFPSDHLYFHFNLSTTALLGVNLYAPSDGWVVQTTRNDYTGGSPVPGVDGDYFVAFAPCREVILNFLHVATLVPALTNPAGASFTRCSFFNVGGVNPEMGSSCTTRLQVPVKAGQLLGTGIVGDFGPLEDTRVALSGFARPGRHNLHRGFCPLNYFAPVPRAALAGLLGADNGGFVARTTAPACGTIMQDVPGTAQGDWYLPGAPDMPDNPHLALIHDNVFPSTAVFSAGEAVPGVASGAYMVFPKTVADGTRVNYDFPLVADTQVYCYDTFRFFPTSSVTALSGHIALLRLNAAADVLTVEFQNPGTDCAGAGAWSFTGAAVDFAR